MTREIFLVAGPARSGPWEQKQAKLPAGEPSRVRAAGHRASGTHSNEAGELSVEMKQGHLLSRIRHALGENGVQPALEDGRGRRSFPVPCTQAGRDLQPRAGGN